jgi:adenosylhomocysteine nucleosidase
VYVFRLYWNTMNDLILLAIEEEAPLVARLPNAHLTGVGKVNAALTVACLIERYRPRRIWNFGTAGGITVGAGIHRCTRFVQRDMQVAALGFLPGHTPFEEGHLLDLGGDGLVCGSGDSFVTDPELVVASDVVDMEAYSLAKACQRAGVELVCFKFISDRADADSSGDWRANVRAGEVHYIKLLRDHGMWTEA